MTTIDLAGSGRTHPAGYNLPIDRKEGNQTVQFGDIHHLVSVDIDVAWAGKTSPLAQEVALRGKDLDTVILPVRHKYAAIAMHPGPVRHMELARCGLAWCSPRLL